MTEQVSETVPVAVVQCRQALRCGVRIAVGVNCVAVLRDRNYDMM